MKFIIVNYVRRHELMYYPVHVHTVLAWHFQIANYNVLNFVCNENYCFFIVVDDRWTSTNIVLAIVGALLLTQALLFGQFATLIYLWQNKSGKSTTKMSIYLQTHEPFLNFFISIPATWKKNTSTILSRHLTSCHNCYRIFIAVCAGAILAFISLALWIAARMIANKEDSKYYKIFTPVNISGLYCMDVTVV